MNIETAKQIATEAHQGQTRWGGEQYITHAEAVVELLHEDDYWGDYSHEIFIVGWLHDVVEDTEITLNDLREKGFNATVINAVDSITKRENEEYLEYLNRVSRNDIATIVKIADLTHNLRGLKQKQRRDKYMIARAYLDLIIAFGQRV